MNGKLYEDRVADSLGDLNNNKYKQIYPSSGTSGWQVVHGMFEASYNIGFGDAIRETMSDVTEIGVSETTNSYRAWGGDSIFPNTSCGPNILWRRGYETNFFSWIPNDSSYN